MKTKLILSIVAMLLLSVFSVAAAPSVDLTPVSLFQSKDPGQDVTFTFNVENTGSENLTDVTFTAEFTNPNLNDPVVDDLSGDLLIGENVDHSFSMTVPGSLLAGAYAGTLTVSAASTTGFVTSVTSFTLLINSVPAFTLDEDAISFLIQPDSEAEVDITLTNTGSSDLTGFTVLYAGKYEDNDGDILDYEFTSLVSPLAPGLEETFTLTVIAEDRLDVDTYSGTVTVTANGVNQVVDLTVEVEPEMCKYGRVGDLTVSLDEPDNGDEFKPGEEIEIEVEVDNDNEDNLDVTVEVILYNLDEDDELRSVDDTQKIKDGDHENYDLTLVVPVSDWDDGDHYALYVKAYEDGNEDEHCDFESIDIDLEREDEDVIVDFFEMTPNPVRAGELVYFRVAVENIGNDPQDDVHILFSEPELGLKEDSPFVELDEYDDKDNDYIWEFTFKVPKNTPEGDYYVEAKVLFDSDDKQDGKLMKLTVTGGVATSDDSGSAATGAVIVSAEQDTLRLKDGQTKLVLPFLVENTGDDLVTLTMDATEYSTWADLIGIEAPKLLNPGDKYHAYVYLELKEDAAAGPHNLRVNTRNANGALITSKLLAVNVPTQVSDDTTATPVAPVEEGKLKEFFNGRSKTFWLIGDLVLIILAIFFIRMLFKK